MKLIHSFIFALSIFVLFSACQNNSAEGMQQKTTQSVKSKVPNSLKIGNTQLSKYRHPLKIYSVLIPSKWVKEYIDKTQTIRMENGPEESIDIISIFGNVKMNDSQEMEEVPLNYKNIAEDYLLDNIKNTLGFSLIENTNFAAVKQGAPGHLVFDYKTPEGIERVRHTILRKEGNKGFYLHLDTSPERFEEADEIFRAMNDSFEVLEEK